MRNSFVKCFLALYNVIYLLRFASGKYQSSRQSIGMLRNVLSRSLLAGPFFEYLTNDVKLTNHMLSDVMCILQYQ